MELSGEVTDAGTVRGAGRSPQGGCPSRRLGRFLGKPLVGSAASVLGAIGCEVPRGCPTVGPREAKARYLPSQTLFGGSGRDLLQKAFQGL